MQSRTMKTFLTKHVSPRKSHLAWGLKTTQQQSMYLGGGGMAQNENIAYKLFK